jgi:hypothetical protein
MFPAGSIADDQTKVWPVAKSSSSFGAGVIVPFAATETPFASPLETSDAELTDQTFV